MTTSIPNAILIQVKNSSGADVPGANVRLYRTSSGFNETGTAGLRCGQVFWNGLSKGTVADNNAYTIDVSAPPYINTTTITGVDVSGYSTFTAVIN
jgi:hypothetical protein